MPLARAKQLIVDFDEAVDRRVDGLRGHIGLDRLMYAASELGDWSLIWHIMGVGQALLPGRDPMTAVRVSAILGVESLLVNGGIKNLFRRHRPVWEEDRPRPHRVRTPQTSSFPSGHASAAFTAAGVLSQGDPLWPIYYGVAVIVASSRVYVKMHHASDVLAGAAIGVGLASIARRVPGSSRSRRGMPAGFRRLGQAVTDRLAFAVTWDYRCPFARNAHEHVVAALRDGAAWDVEFVPFSLGQVHVAEGEPDIWSHWQDDSGLLALQVGVVVRDKFPDQFLDVHGALFALRHDHAGHLRDEGEVRAVLEAQGVDADVVFAEIATGNPIATIQQAHETAAKEHHVWGVPTFIRGDRAVFVRLMDRPQGDAAHARRSVERVLDLLDGFVELNEYKHTSIPR